MQIMDRILRTLAMVVGLGAVLVGCSFNSMGLPGTDGASVTADSALKDGPLPDKPQKKDVGKPDKTLDKPKPDKPKGCTQGMYKCVAKESHVCKGGDVFTLDTVCPMDCNHQTGRCFNYVHSNGVTALVGQSTKQWTINGGVTVDTNTGKMTPPQTGVAIYDKTKWWVIVVGKMVLEKDVTLKVVGGKPLIIVAWDYIHLKGTLDVSANGTTPGPGGGAGGVTSQSGKGCGAGSKGSNPGAFDPWGGGAGGSFGGKGGAGSDPGKIQCGDVCLQPLFGGSGGGGGRNINGQGGAGGGGVQLTAGSAIVVDGVIHAGGGGGRGGKYGDTGAGGGGGGSGGGVLLEAIDVIINGVVAANGGAGGGSATLTNSGGSGKDGDTTSTVAAGGKAGAGWFAGAGGNGGAYTSIHGTAGGPGVASIGGGGGGVGRICVRTKSGKIKGKGTLTPNHKDALAYKQIKLK